MTDKEFDRYVSYVIAQVGEGNHSKEEVKEDLLSRGLIEHEVDEILDVAWSTGKNIENDANDNAVVEIAIALVPSIIVVVCMVLAGYGILECCSFGIIFGGIIALVRIKFHKRKFR